MKKCSLILSKFFTLFFCSTVAFAINFLPLPDDIIGTILEAGSAGKLTVQKDTTEDLLTVVNAVKTDSAYTNTDADSDKISNYQDYKTYQSEANNTTYYIYKEENKLYPGYAKQTYTGNDEDKKVILEVHTNIPNDLLSFQGSTDTKLQISANLEVLRKSYGIENNFNTLNESIRNFNYEIPETVNLTIEKNKSEELLTAIKAVESDSGYTKESIGYGFEIYSSNDQQGTSQVYLTFPQSHPLYPNYVKASGYKNRSHFAIEAHTSISDEIINFVGSHDDKISLDINFMSLLGQVIG